MNLLPFTKKESRQLVVPNKTVSRRRVLRVNDLFQLLVILDTSPSTLVSNAHEAITGSIHRILEVLEIKDPLVFASIELSICGFGEKHGWEVYLPYTPAPDIGELPQVPDVSSTHIFEAHCAAIAESKTRMEFAQREEGREVRAAWVFEMSDYQATSPDVENFARAAREATADASKSGVSIFHFLAGAHANEQVAASIAQPGCPVVQLELNDFETTFADWVVKSVRSQSMSQFGQTTALADFKGTPFTTGLTRHDD